jgi:hypothetical protein
VRVFLLLCLTGILMGTSLFKCKEVHNYQEMANIRLGLPVPFLSVNMQRYTPLEYPQCFRVGSPWADPMRVMWAGAAVDVALIFALLYGMAAVGSRAWQRASHKR